MELILKVAKALFTNKEKMQDLLPSLNEVVRIDPEFILKVHAYPLPVYFSRLPSIVAKNLIFA